MILYLILANLYLAIFYTFYYLFLRKETFFKLNRYFLLTSMVLAFTLPSANIPAAAQLGAPFLQGMLQNNEGNTLINSVLLGPIEISNHQTLSNSVTANSSGNFSDLTLIYLLGCCISLIIFIVRIFRSFRSFKQQHTNRAFSFFSLVCVGKELAGHKQIVLHENVHAKEWHSMDIILIQIIKTVNWFNPFVYAMERSIRLQHEYRADSLASGIHQVGYAQLLLATALSVSPFELNNQFNHPSLLKSRIIMLLKNKTPKQKLTKLLLILPLIAGMITLSSACQLSGEKQESQNGSMNESNEIVEAAKATATAALPLDTENMQPDTIPFVSFDKLEIHPKPHNDEYNTIQEFRTWIAKNFVLPKEALEANVSGNMEATFIIDKNGNVSNVEITKDLGYGTEEVYQALLEKNHKWKPGILNGQAVSTKYTLPLKIIPTPTRK